MYYDFGRNTNEEMMNEIDSNDMKTILIEKYDIESIPFDDQLIKIKALVKNKKEFQLLSDSTSINKPEIIRSLVRLYPKIFNHHLIKFVKEHYINVV